MAALVEKMTHIPQENAHLIAKNATLAFAIGIVMIWNFFMNRYSTYNGID